MSPIKELVVLACTQAVPNPAVLNEALKHHGLRARIIQEPCSSKVEAFQLLRILATGADLVWVVGCPEQYCQLVEGSTRMGFRVGVRPEFSHRTRFGAGTTWIVTRGGRKSRRPGGCGRRDSPTS